MSTPAPAPERAVAPRGDVPEADLTVDDTFADLGVPEDLVRSLAARGIAAPFPIQAATLPDALDGRDVCGRAPTGSGKTIAFGIPLVLTAEAAKPGRPKGLVLVPTRELAAQVTKELELLAGRRGPSVHSFYGGVGFGPQLKALRRGVDIAVACPGRLADLISQGAIRLDQVEIVVVDEADRMADMGFLPEVRRLLDQCPEDRQTLLFSATLDGDVDILTTRYQRDPARHEPPHTDDHGRIDHRWWQVERAERIATTAALIDRLGPTVVFCRTRHGADRVARQLEAAGVKAAAIHGGRSQGQRDKALQAFHRGTVAALVATDVAARGIHVEGVTCVIHFDPPADEKDYVHRSGRTARAGTDGVVVTLVGREVRKAVTSLQRSLGHPTGLDQVDLEALEATAPPKPEAKPKPTRADHAGRSATTDRRPRSDRSDRSERPQGAGPNRAARRAEQARLLEEEERRARSGRPRKPHHRGQGPDRRDDRRDDRRGEGSDRRDEGSDRRDERDGGRRGEPSTRPSRPGRPGAKPGGSKPKTGPKAKGKAGKGAKPGGATPRTGPKAGHRGSARGGRPRAAGGAPRSR